MQTNGFDVFAADRPQSVFPYMDTSSFEVTEVKQYHNTTRKLYTVKHRSTAQTLSVLAYSLDKMTWEEREQLSREISVLKRVSHQNIPRLRLAEEHGRTMFLVMDHVIGAPVDAVAKFRKFAIPDTEQLILQVASVLDYLHHKENLGHGDINPRNIFVCETDKGLQVMVLGFGNSRLDGTTVENPLSVSGTPGFVPKWQSCNPDLRATADLFSLGMTAFCAHNQIPMDEISGYIDEETGEPDIPFDAFGIHWYLTQWVWRITSDEHSYSSAREAIDHLRKLKQWWKLFPIRCAVATLAGVILSGMFWGYAFFKQGNYIRTQEEAHQVLRANADSLYEEALEIKKQREEEARRQREALARRRRKEQEAAEQRMIAEKRAAALNRLKTTKSCRGCDLESADLSSLDLAGANLQRANLRGVKFVSTRLEGANLSGADLFRADLRSSNLKRANLSGANLSGAILDDANATQACFQATNLSKTDFWGTDMTNASFERADLETASFGFFPERSGAIDPTGEVYRGETTAAPNCQ